MIASFVLTALALLECRAQFVTQWNCLSITLPFSNNNQTLDIDWGDGNTSNKTSNFSHDYENFGVYNISITGEVRKFSFFGAQTFKSSLIKILQWGEFIVDSSSGVFFGCDMLEEISAPDQPKFVVNATMAYMFQGCKKLNSPLSWNVTNVISMRQTFCDCITLNQPIVFINTRNVRDMSAMFLNCQAFNFPLSLDLSSTLLAERMFYGAINFNSSLDFTNSGSLTSVYFMFYNASQYNKPLYLDLSNVTSCGSMFAEASNFNSPVNFVSTSNLMDASKMFDGALNFNQPINFTTGQMVFANGMFRNCHVFNQPITFDASSLTTISEMFSECHELNQPVTLINSGRLTEMRWTFSNAVKFNQPVNWDTSSVTAMDFLFYNSSFNQAITFNTTSVDSMDSMFAYSPFNQAVTFDTQNVRIFNRMFKGTQHFQNANQSFRVNVSRTQEMYQMFDKSAFSQDLTLWTIHGPFLYSCDEFCPQCGLPDFSLTVCDPCGHPVKYSFAGVRQCACPPDERDRGAGCDRTFRAVWQIVDVPFTLNLSFRNSEYVWWGDHSDGIYDMYNNITHNYIFPGNYTIDIFGPLTQFRINRGKSALIRIEQWGRFTVDESNFGGHFSGCRNLMLAAKDQPFFTSESLLTDMFAFSTNFDSLYPLRWNVSGVVFVNGMFKETKFNQDIVFTGAQSIVGTSDMFKGNINFNSKVIMDTSNVQDMQSMFQGCSAFNQPLSFNTSSVIYSMENMFDGCISFNQTLAFDLSRVEAVNGMFANTSYKFNLASWNASSVKSERCSDFCVNCGLPAFPSCNPCTNGSVVSSKGWRMCSCSVGDVCVPYRVSNSPTPQSCSTCDLTVNSSGNVSQTVLVGSNTSVVSVTLPSSIFRLANITNITVRIVILPFSSGPNTTQAPGGSVILSIKILEQEKERPGFISLDDPISFVIPLTDEAKVTLSAPSPCTAVRVQCVWRDGDRWVDSGCQATVVGNGTQCECTHLTDFAVLLDQKSTCDAEQQPVTVYYPFVVFYILILLYCGISTALLIKATTSKAKHTSLIIHHALVGLVALLRLISCLQFLNVISDSLGLKAFLSALPYPLEYVLFTRLAFSWMGLVHFAMITGDAQWKKLRPLFLVTNVLGTLLAIAVFVVFAVEASESAAIIGTIVLSALYLCLGILFQVYAVLLQRQLQEAVGVIKYSNASKPPVLSCGLQDRIKWTGRSTTLCFIIQALCNIGSILSPSEQLEGWTAGFLTANVLALISLLVIFVVGMTKVVVSSNLAMLKITQSGASFDRSSRPSSVNGSLKSSCSSVANEGSSRPARSSAPPETVSKHDDVEMLRFTA